MLKVEIVLKYENLLLLAFAVLYQVAVACSSCSIALSVLGYLISGFGCYHCVLLTVLTDSPAILIFMTDLFSIKSMHFLCFKPLEPKSVLKFS